ncbi:MAG TPA: hypothetical protein VFP58_13340 [Candidatus Eisenbacteria bacterium]|nr:hypothetical protein [Candidatus Eisenbacteria bacterium]
MRDYSLTRLRDDVLLRDLAALIVEERTAIASVLAYLAEVDTRTLYIPLGYSSLYAYCREELRLSEDTTCKRIQAARAARRFPILFTELAEGRLHVTAVCMLAPHLTDENVEELVRAATHRRKSEIEELLACCLPSGAQTLLAPEGEPAPEQVNVVSGGSGPCGLDLAAEPAPEQVNASHQPAPEQVDGSGTGPLLSQVESLVPLMVRPGTRDRARYLQALLSHAIPSGDISQVLDRAMDLLTEEVEKRRFGTGAGVRRRRTGIWNRYIPAQVRHAVWNRDGGRCTFVGSNGHRCHSDKFLEFDHVNPRNREDTVEGLRLRCRVHNQYEAERVFGTEFMNRKREEARLAKEAGLAQKAQERAKAKAEIAADAEVEEQIQDVLSALRGLGIKGDQARRAAARARTLDNATLPDRIRAALQFHGECISRSPKAARLLYASG